jgi:hypothetical protein
MFSISLSDNIEQRAARGLCSAFPVRPDTFTMKGNELMSMVVDITPERGFLRVQAGGDFSLDEANEVTLSVFRMLSQHALHKVLLDWRQVKGEPTLVERYIFAVSASEEMLRAYHAGECRVIRFAFVAEEPLIDSRRFGETVAVNRGMNVVVTTSLAEALLWLEIDPTEPFIAK